MVDDSTRQALLARFTDWLDATEDLPDAPAEPEEAADLFSVFTELAGLRTELRTESRLVKEALDQFRSAFDTLQSSHATMQRELDRARAGGRDERRAALRPLLLDVVDLRDRLAAALSLPVVPPPWPERLWRRSRGRDGAWQEGLGMTLRRFDEVLQDRGVQRMELLRRPLDPALARVVGTVADRTTEAGTVVEEARAGFLWEDQVLRTAEVIVSAPGPGAGSGAQA